MEEKLITVTKTASDKLPPDTVDISITAVGSAKKYADAVSGAESKSAATVAALKAAGFSEVRLLGVNVSTQRDGGKTVGYRAARALELHFAFDGKRLGEALDALGKSDCEWRIAFSLKDRSKRGELIARAVKAAQTEAGIIAEAAGVKLGGLCKAEYCSTDGDGARPMLMKAAVYAAGDSGAAEPETITLSETVTCGFSILNS
ncbi:MAG: SIMPL domain-containing protein [Clostridiales bacterium]|nr:SIMPL domain-containing protein [Clostridiales bacterium]